MSQSSSKATDVYCHNFSHLSLALLSIPPLMQEPYFVLLSSVTHWFIPPLQSHALCVSQPADEEETAGLEDLDLGSVVDQTFAEL